jgi:HEAT repeat protein
LVVLLIAIPAPAADPPKVADLVRQLETGSPGERVIAAELLGDLGPPAAEAAPALARAALKTRVWVLNDDGNLALDTPDEFLFDACLEALESIGPKANPALVELLAHKDSHARWRVLLSLGHARPGVAAVLPALIKCLADPSPMVQAYAAEAIGAFGPAAEPAIPALIDLFLGRKEPGCSPDFGPPLRPAALRALVRIGPKAEPAIREKVVPAITEELRAGTVGRAGELAFVQDVIGEAGAPAVPVLVESARKPGTVYERAQFTWSLVRLGPPGRKASATLFADPNPDLRRAMVVALSDAPPQTVTPFVPQLLAALKDEEPEHLSNAVTALAQLGDKAPQEVVAAIAGLLDDPAVMKRLRSKYDTDGITFWLSRCGDKGAWALTAALTSNDPAVRTAAAKDLGRIRLTAKPALPELRRMALADPDPTTAAQAATTAAAISLDPADLAPLFTPRLLRHPVPEVRYAALGHLEALATLVADRQDEFVRMLDDKETRWGAARVLVSLGPDATPAARRALATWNQVPKEKGGFGFEFDTPAGTVPKERLPEFIDELKRNRGGDARGAWWMIERIGPAAKEALPSLLEELRAETSASNGRAALGALGAIGPAAKDAVPEVMKRLAEPDDDWRIPAALCLGAIGPDARAAAPALKKLLTEPNPELRLAATYALARVENDLPSYRPQLVRLSRSKTIRYENVFAEVFDRLAPDCPELLPAAAEMIGSSLVGETIVTGFRKYGRAARETVPTLRKRLTEMSRPEWFAYGGPGRWVYEPCQVLGAIGPDAKEALPDLRRLLDHPDAGLALAARDAISKIEGK